MSELTELLITPAPQIERVALAIARDEYPGLDAHHYLRELDRLAAPLYRAILARSQLADRAAWLVDYLYGELGFVCIPDESQDPKRYYLNDVLDQRCGTSTSLAAVLMALGERVGLAVDGIGLAHHFLVRLGGMGGIYIDLLQRGRLLEPNHLKELATQAFGATSFDERQVRPATARQIALRLLLALKTAHEHLGDHARAMVVCDRLVDLTNAPDHYRDRGVHALALGAPAAAAADLTTYLTERPDAADGPRVRELLNRAVAGKRQPSH